MSSSSYIARRIHSHICSKHSPPTYPAHPPTSRGDTNCWGCVTNLLCQAAASNWCSDNNCHITTSL